MRNIALCLWYDDCKECVTVDKCLKVLGLRGVVRVWCSEQLKRVLHFMSRKGYINQGMMTGATPLAHLHPVERKVS